MGPITTVLVGVPVALFWITTAMKAGEVAYEKYKGVKGKNKQQVTSEDKQSNKPKKDKRKKYFSSNKKKSKKQNKNQVVDEVKKPTTN